MRSLLLALTACAVATFARADHPSVTLGGHAGGPIQTTPGETPARGTSSFSLRFELLDLEAMSDQQLKDTTLAGHHVHSTASLRTARLSFAHAVTDRILVGAQATHVSRRDIREAHLQFVGPGMVELEVADSGSPSGLGDATIYGQFRVASGPRHALSLIAGVDVPVGSTSEAKSDGHAFEVEHQPGSGSWDPLAGVAFTRRWARSSLHASLVYSFSREGERDTTIGDLASYDVAWVRRFGGPGDPVQEHHHAHDGHDHEDGDAAHGHGVTDAPARRLAWDLVVELNGQAQERRVVNGREVADSGETVAFVAPGVRVSGTGGWSVFASLGVPIIENINGVAHGTDHRAVLGVSFNL